MVRQSSIQAGAEGSGRTVPMIVSGHRFNPASCTARPVRPNIPCGCPIVAAVLTGTIARIRSSRLVREPLGHHPPIDRPTKRSPSRPNEFQQLFRYPPISAAHRIGAGGQTTVHDRVCQIGDTKVPWAAAAGSGPQRRRSVASELANTQPPSSGPSRGSARRTSAYRKYYVRTFLQGINQGWRARG